MTPLGGSSAGLCGAVTPLTLTQGPEDTAWSLQRKGIGISVQISLVMVWRCTLICATRIRFPGLYLLEELVQETC